MGLPLESSAGVKRALRVISLHVASSRVAEPLDDVTLQSVTRPLVPTVTRKPVVPSSSFLRELVGLSALVVQLHGMERGLDPTSSRLGCGCVGGAGGNRQYVL